MRNTGFICRRALSIVCVLLMTGVFLAAQEPAPPAAAPAPAQAWSPEQLDNLVAPIALYPDALLSQVLVAATYPLEVVEAGQWLQQNRNLRGRELTDAARQQNWDASIQALVAFPDVVNRLSSNIQWTTDLGNAFLAQQADVMNAVQRMRAQARAAGKLNSSPEETVTTQTQGGQTVIEIQPANPEVVYVPSYNPEYIWGPPVWGYYPPLYYPGFDFGFGFGPGIFIGGFWGGLGWGGWGWGPNWFGCSIFLNPFFFHHYGYHGFYGGGGFRGGFRGGAVWAHNPQHRLGVPYSNAALANRFHGVSGARAGVGQRQFGGQRLGTPRGPAVSQSNPGGNFTSRGNTGARAPIGAQGRPQANGAQAGGWHRFGQSGTGNVQSSGHMNAPATSPSSGGAQGRFQTNSAQAGGWHSFGESGAGNFGRSTPMNTPATSSYRGGNRSYAGGGSLPSYRPSPSYGGGNYGASRIAPSYRPSPSYNRGYRASNSYGGGSYMGGRTMPSYRSSPAYGGGRAYRSSPSYSGGRSFGGGGGGGGYHASSGGSFHGGGGGSSHGGGGGHRH